MSRMVMATLKALRYPGPEALKTHVLAFVRQHAAPTPPARTAHGVRLLQVLFLVWRTEDPNKRHHKDSGRRAALQRWPQPYEEVTHRA